MSEMSTLVLSFPWLKSPHQMLLKNPKSNPPPSSHLQHHHHHHRRRPWLLPLNDRPQTPV